MGRGCRGTCSVLQGQVGPEKDPHPPQRGSAASVWLAWWQCVCWTACSPHLEPLQRQSFWRLLAAQLASGCQSWAVGSAAGRVHDAALLAHGQQKLYRQPGRQYGQEMFLCGERQQVAGLTGCHAPTMGPGAGVELLTQLLHCPLQLQVAVLQQLVLVHLRGSWCGAALHHWCSTGLLQDTRRDVLHSCDIWPQLSYTLNTCCCVHGADWHAWCPPQGCRDSLPRS